MRSSKLMFFFKRNFDLMHTLGILGESEYQDDDRIVEIYFF